ncbi:hypothetical protein PENSPDRAFT_430957 [Peniophora sp. CONT]|nr:hypothetical protein PENSPDRAFT_430957 [Peniophora sp. CONT]
MANVTMVNATMANATMANVTIDPTSEGVVAFDDVYSTRTDAFENLLLVTLYGFLVYAFVTAVYDLWKAGLRSRYNRVHLCAVIAMFAATTAYVIGNIIFIWDDFYWLAGRASSKIVHTDALSMTLQNYVWAINIVLGDVVILWRVHIIWAKRKLVRWISICLLCATLVSWALEIGQQVDDVAVPVSLATSCWSTAAISYKAW